MSNKEIKKETVFIQSACREITGTFGSFYSININKADFNNLPTDSAGYVKLTMNAYKNGKNEYGHTHYLTLNQYQPKKEIEDEKL